MKTVALNEKWQADIDNRLAAMQKAWSKSKGIERDHCLLGALNLCGPFRPLPDWLCSALREILTERLSQPPVIWLRWNLVRALKDVSKLTWDETWERASKMLAGTAAQGGTEAIRKSYQAYERGLPLEQRRPRTYRRKPPLG